MSDVTDLVERFRAFAHQWLKGSLRDDDIYTFTDATGEHTIRASDLLSAAAALATIKQTDAVDVEPVAWLPHDGEGCPVAKETPVEIITRSGVQSYWPKARSVVWRYGTFIAETGDGLPKDAEVVFYRKAIRGAA